LTNVTNPTNYQGSRYKARESGVGRWEDDRQRLERVGGPVPPTGYGRTQATVETSQRRTVVEASTAERVEGIRGLDGPSCPCKVRERAGIDAGFVTAQHRVSRCEKGAP